MRRMPATRVGNVILFEGGGSITISRWAQLLYKTGVRSTVVEPDWQNVNYLRVPLRPFAGERLQAAQRCVRRNLAWRQTRRHP